ncbi:MAG: UDP-N-acetylglucosamine 2-epimerase [Syntrophomonadaceae bacterium]|nr:UDP-N-acetylglucosamine 2-epimerase [Syntrophomonadaceae bacterium]
MVIRKICVVTGSRAEYGLLYWLLQGIAEDPELDLQIIATGMHLSPELGLTYRVIEKDGFTINAKVEMLLSSDSPVAVTKSLGLGIIGMADALEVLLPDIVVVLGDRYEIFAAAQAAMIARIPLAHIAGGDITEGAMDEAIRHSISKMAHLHFVTNAAAAERVRRLGENPNHIYNVGSPGIDYIKRLAVIPRRELARLLDFEFKDKNLLITFHPVTLDPIPSSEQLRELLAALDSLPHETGLIFTKANADMEGQIINQMIENFVASHSNARLYSSLGQLLYLNTITYVDAVVGNSSSGLYEVPSFKKPTVNIGDRQKGRMQAASVINCPPRADRILEAISRAFSLDCSDTLNPYGDGNSSKRVIQILKSISAYQDLLKKHFY